MSYLTNRQYKILHELRKKYPLDFFKRIMLNLFIQGEIDSLADYRKVEGIDHIDLRASESKEYNMRLESAKRECASDQAKYAPQVSLFQFAEDSVMAEINNSRRRKRSSLFPRRKR